MAVGTEVNIALAFTVASNTATKAFGDLGKSLDTLERRVMDFGDKVDDAAVRMAKIGGASVVQGFANITRGATQAGAAIQGMGTSAATAFSGISNSLGATASRFAQLGTNVAGAARSAATGGWNALGSAFQTLQRHTQNFGLELRQLDRTMQYLIAFGLGKFAHSVLETANSLQRSTLEIGVFSGSFDQANQSIDKILQVTQKVPFSLKAMTDAFVKLKASGIEPITGANGEGPLLTLSNAVAAFGGSTDVFERAILAISQMAGKGVISMEELRQQLGEALPTALRSMAAGLGLPVSKLISEISKGNIEFKRGTDALFSELEKQYAGVGNVMLTTLGGSFQALKTEFDKLILSLNRAGVFDVITATLTVAKDRLEAFVASMQTADGKDYLKNLQERFIRLVEKIDAALPSTQRFLDLLLTIGEAVVSVLSKLSGEQTAYGVLGFLIWGRAGALVGALFGDQIDAIVKGLNGVGEASKSMFSAIGSAGDSLVSEAAGYAAMYGYIGYRLLGVPGALVGALSGVAKAAQDAMKKDEAPQQQQMIDSVGAGSPFAQAATLFAGLAKSMGVFGSSTQASADKVATSVDRVGTSVDSTKPKVAGLGDVLRKQIESFDVTRKKVDEINQRANSYDPGAAVTKSMTEYATALRSAQEKAAGDGNAFAASMVKQQRVAESLSPAIMKVSEDIQTLAVKMKEAEAGVASAETPGARKLANGLAEMYQEQYKQAFALKRDLVKQQEDMYAALNGQTDAYQREQSKKAAVFLAEQKKAQDSLELTMKESKLKSSGGDPQLALDIVALRSKADTQERINQLTLIEERIQANTTLTEEQRNTLLEKTAALKAQASSQAGQEMKHALDMQQIENSQAALAVQKLTRQEEYNLSILKAKANFDTVAEAGLTANNQILASLDAIDEKILQIQGNPLIGEESKNISIARLRAIKAEMQTTGAQVVEQTKFQASEAGKFWSNVGSTIESTLGSSIDGLIKGTKKMKDVMMDFWSSITTAVANYLAKEAMVKLFGEGGLGGSAASMSSGGSGGGILGSLLKLGVTAAATYFGGPAGFSAVQAGSALFNTAPIGGGTGGLFASGGSFMVGGTGATDTVPVGFMATPGERVTVDTPNKMNRGGGSNGTVNVTINALDGANVQEVLMRNADAIFGTMSRRSSLNRGFR